MRIILSNRISLKLCKWHLHETNWKWELVIWLCRLTREISLASNPYGYVKRLNSTDVYLVKCINVSLAIYFEMNCTKQILLTRDQSPMLMLKYKHAGRNSGMENRVSFQLGVISIIIINTFDSIYSTQIGHDTKNSIRKLNPILAKLLVTPDTSHFLALCADICDLFGDKSKGDIESKLYMQNICWDFSWIESHSIEKRWRMARKRKLLWNIS